MRVFDCGDSVRIDDAGPFSLTNTFSCGQCFRFLPDEDGSYTGVAYGKALTLFEEDGAVVLSCSEEDFDGLWRDYFDLDRDYDALCRTFCRDDYTANAIRFGRGLRLLKQEPFETLISFILSQCNNLGRIRRIVSDLCRLAGGKIDMKGRELYTFPKPSDIARMSESELSSLKAGYRAPYVREAALATLRGEVDFRSLRRMDTPDARREIMRLPGVGEKVADCFLLFGLSKYDAFPVDVWMKRAIKENPSVTPARFGELCGIAQQYIFYFARETGSKGRRLPSKGEEPAQCV